MKLTNEQIKELATGAVRFEEKDEVLHLFRFTQEQQELYRGRGEGHRYRNTFSTAGIRLVFRTDSRTLYLKVQVDPGCSRKYFSFDIFADGRSLGHMDNFSDAALPRNYTGTDLIQGEKEGAFELGEGIKIVTVYLPWSAVASIKALELEDGAFYEAVKPRKKLLAFGDSITQGYDALRPSNRYVARIADLLGAEEFNKGIGGEVFFPELAAERDSLQPDYITVAYGTNDWGKKDADTFLKDCRAFYRNLSCNYPGVRIFAITPIWRAAMDEIRMVGKFEDLEQLIRKAVEGLENVTVLTGFDFVPKNEDYFADLRLHPNDEGFAHYAQNLYAAMKKEIGK